MGSQCVYKLISKQYECYAELQVKYYNIAVGEDVLKKAALWWVFGVIFLGLCSSKGAKASILWTYEI